MTLSIEVNPQNFVPRNEMISQYLCFSFPPFNPFKFHNCVIQCILLLAKSEEKKYFIILILCLMAISHVASALVWSVLPVTLLCLS